MTVNLQVSASSLPQMNVLSVYIYISQSEAVHDILWLFFWDTFVSTFNINQDTIQVLYSLKNILMYFRQRLFAVVIRSELFHSNVIKKHVTDVWNQIFKNLNHGLTKLRNWICFVLNKCAISQKTQHYHETCQIATFFVKFNLIILWLHIHKADSL